MDQKPSRITVTLKGKKLQEDLRIDTAEDFYLQTTTTRSVTHSDFNFRETPSSSAPFGTCRTGYFRPKYDSHVVLKTPESGPVYPNYMKRDPREYTTKHACAWTPKPTTEGRHQLPTSYATNLNVHHTLFKPELNPIIHNTNIKDANTLVSGRFGYIPLHLTNCKYPDSKFVVHTEGIEASRMISPTNNSQIDLNGSKFLSDMSMTMQSGFKGRDNNFKSSLLSTTSNFGMKNTLQKRFARNSSNPRMDTSMLGLNTSMNRIFMKSSEEKIDQIIGNQKRSQKEYEDTLNRIGEKIKQKYERQQENASYLPELKSKLQMEKTTLEELTVEKDREKVRYQGRLAERKKLKFGKAWKNHANFLNKCNSERNIEAKAQKQANNAGGSPNVNLMKRISEVGTNADKRNSGFKAGYVFAQNNDTLDHYLKEDSLKILPSYNKL